MRRILLILVLLAPTEVARAQNPQTIDEQFRELRSEVLRLRQELDEVKQQLRDRDETVEQLPLLQAQVQEQAQTKVEANSRMPLKIFGTVAANTFFNSGEPNWLDLPNLVNPPNPAFPPGTLGFSLRETRIGALFEGPRVAGMRMNGTVAMDFFGGIPNFQTGDVIPLPRLLYAYMRLDGEKTAIEIGQDSMILAPKNPTSLAGMSFPTLYRSGNLYLRAPQIRAERVLASGGLGQFRAVGGVLAPVSGDFTNAFYQFVPPPLAGERSKTPFVQSRLSWRAIPAGPYEQPRWELAASGHYGRERFATGMTPTWAGSIDFDATAGRFGIGGEYFAGQNLDAFGGSLGQLAKSQGGFAEGRFAATSRLSFNGGYGMDRLFDLDRFPAQRAENATVYANGIYSFTPEFRGGLEYQRLTTKPVGVGVDSNRNHHINLTFAYSF